MLILPRTLKLTTVFIIVRHTLNSDILMTYVRLAITWELLDEIIWNLIFCLFIVFITFFIIQIKEMSCKNFCLIHPSNPLCMPSQVFIHSLPPPHDRLGRVHLLEYPTEGDACYRLSPSPDSRARSHLLPSVQRSVISFFSSYDRPPVSCVITLSLLIFLSQTFSCFPVFFKTNSQTTQPLKQLSNNSVLK